MREVRSERWASRKPKAEFTNGYVRLVVAPAVIGTNSMFRKMSINARLNRDMFLYRSSDSLVLAVKVLHYDETNKQLDWIIFEKSGTPRSSGGDLQLTGAVR